MTEDQSVSIEEFNSLVPDRFDAMGYGSVILIENMGAFFVFIMIFLIWLVLFFGVHMILSKAKKVPNCLEIRYPKVTSALRWGFFLRALSETYLEMVLGLLINL